MFINSPEFDDIETEKNTAQLEKVFEAYKENHSLGNPDEVSSVSSLVLLTVSLDLTSNQNLLDASHDLAAHATSECILLSEIEIIDTALGGQFLS